MFHLIIWKIFKTDGFWFLNCLLRDITILFDVKKLQRQLFTSLKVCSFFLVVLLSVCLFVCLQFIFSFFTPNFTLSWRVRPRHFAASQGWNIGTHCVLDLCWNVKSLSSLFAIFKTYSEDKTTHTSISPSAIVHWVHIVAIVALRLLHLNSRAGHMNADGK